MSVQPASMTATKASRMTTGSTRPSNLARSPFGRTGGGPTWVRREGRTRTMAAAWASAAISGPEHSGGVSGTRNIGWGALRWQEMIGTDEVWFGKHSELRYLPKKIANFLHEFHADDFGSLGLPPLPSDRSRLNVHAMLRPIHISRLLQRLKVVIMMNNVS